MRALAKQGDRRATAVLHEVLSSTEPMVRYDAAFAHGEIQALDALRPAVHGEP
jgi:HEAT repeat protein